MIRINTINYDGALPLTEADEFIEITNSGHETVDISNWVIKAGMPSATGSQRFTFPSGTTLQPGERKRVYTNMPEQADAFSFNSKIAIWSNNGETGIIYDAEGNVVDSYSYPLDTPDLLVTSELLPGGEGIHDFGKLQLDSGKKTVVFTIENLRPDTTLALTGNPVVSVNAGAEAFTVVTQPEASVDRYGKVSFEVAFDPGSTGQISGELSIPVDGLEQPYVIPLSGTAVSRGRLRVYGFRDGDFYELPSGSSYEYGKATVLRPCIGTFRIENDGGAPLTISCIKLTEGSDFYRLEGNWSQISLDEEIIAPGESITFSYIIYSRTTGKKSTKLSIISDASSNDYELTINGMLEAEEPNIVLSVAGNGLPENASVFMGNLAVGSTDSKEIRITNTGNTKLHIQGIDVLDKINYSVSPSLQNMEIDPGSSKDVTVHFAPQSVTVQTTQLVIKSDDPDQGELRVWIQGRAYMPCPEKPKKAPRFVLEQYLYPVRRHGCWNPRLPNGAKVDDSRYGPISNHGNVIFCYVIKNVGELDLIVDEVAFTNNDAQFNLTMDPNSFFTTNFADQPPPLPFIIKPGCGYAFYRWYSNMTSGSRWSTIKFHTNDPDQEDFIIHHRVPAWYVATSKEHAYSKQPAHV